MDSRTGINFNRLYDRVAVANCIGVDPVRSCMLR